MPGETVGAENCVRAGQAGASFADRAVPRRGRQIERSGRPIDRAAAVLPRRVKRVHRDHPAPGECRLHHGRGASRPARRRRSAQSVDTARRRSAEAGVRG